VLTITKRLWTLPRLPAARAVELSDGAPRAFDQVRQNAARLRRVVDGAELATVAGSNNHGWGATAAAWSVLMIPGWRSLPPDALDAAIRRRLWRGGRRAVSVVERRRVEPGATPLALAATVPAVGWGVLVTLSGAERAAWLAWAWGAWALVRVARRTRVRARPARRSPVLAGARRPAA
jgi:hypothetical protein